MTLGTMGWWMDFEEQIYWSRHMLGDRDNMLFLKESGLHLDSLGHWADGPGISDDDGWLIWGVMG